MITRLNSQTKPGEQRPELPLALLFCTDLMFTTQIQNIARAAGFRAAIARPGLPLSDASVLIVDLASRGDWEAAIREAGGVGVRVVAFGPHMDSIARRRAKSAGAFRVLANSNLTRELPAILRTIYDGL